MEYSVSKFRDSKKVPLSIDMSAFECVIINSLKFKIVSIYRVSYFTITLKYERYD